MEQIKKKILVLGSKGMAGHVIYYYLKACEKFIVLDVSRNNDHFESTCEIDVTDISRLEKIFENLKPDVVVNCIGILNKEAERHPDKAIFLNSFFPHYLAQKGKKYHFRLIHISTDCVFSGKKGAYSESDIKDATGFYGASKSLGEVVYDSNLTFRTSIIGPELKKSGIGLFNWFMRQSGVIKGYTKAIWTGVTTIELAKAVEIGIEREIGGLYQLVNNEAISKYELISMFKREFNRSDIIIQKDDLYAVNKSLIDTRKIFKITSYLSMIEEMREWIEKRAFDYPDYYQPR